MDFERPGGEAAHLSAHRSGARRARRIGERHRARLRRGVVAGLATLLSLLAAGGAPATDWLAGDALAPARDRVLEGELEEAVPRLEALLAEDAADSRARYALVWCLLELGRIDDAREVAGEGERRAPGDGWSWAALGDVRLRLGMLEEARAAYRKGVVRKNPRARLGLGALLESEREMVAARDQYRRAWEADPEDPEIVLAMARAAPDQKRQVELARRGLAASFSLEPDERAMLEAALDSRARLEEPPLCTLAEGAEGGEVRLRRIRPRAGERKEAYQGAKISLNGGKPFVTLLDTGASGLLVARSLAEKAGLPLLAEVWFQGLGPEGRRPARLALVERLEIADVAFENCLATVVDDGLLRGSLGGHDALMGLDLLYWHFELALDFPAARLRLQPLPPLPESEDGVPDLFALERDASKIARGYVPVRIFGEDILFPTLVDGDRRAWFLLDTGASTNLLSRRFAATFRTLRPAGVRVRGLSGEIREVEAATNVDLQVGGIRQPHDSILVLDLDLWATEVGHGIQGIVGFALLRHTVTRIDFRNALVRIEPARR